MLENGSIMDVSSNKSSKNNSLDESPRRLKAFVESEDVKSGLYIAATGALIGAGVSTIALNIYAMYKAYKMSKDPQFRDILGIELATKKIELDEITKQMESVNRNLTNTKNLLDSGIKLMDSDIKEMRLRIENELKTIREDKDAQGHAGPINITDTGVRAAGILAFLAAASRVIDDPQYLSVIYTLIVVVLIKLMFQDVILGDKPIVTTIGDIGNNARDRVKEIVAEAIGVHPDNVKTAMKKMNAPINVRLGLANTFGVSENFVVVMEELSLVLAYGTILWKSKSDSVTACASVMYGHHIITHPFFSEFVSFIPRLISAAKELHEPQDVQGHLGETNNSFYEACHGLIKSITGLFGGSNKRITKDEKFAIDSLRSSVGLVKDVGHFVEWLVALCYRLFQFIYIRVTGKPFVTEDKRYLIETAMKWVCACEELQKRCPEPNLTSNPSTLLDFIRLGSLGNALARTVVEHQYRLDNFPVFFNMQAKMGGFATQANQLLKTSQIRPEPLGLVLLGSPGVGKTSVTDMIINDVMAHLGRKYDASCRYERDPTDQYWSRYQNQEVTTYDDLFQSRDPDIRMRTANEIIRCVNSAPFPLNMADLASKGNTYFTSSLVIATSNAVDLEHTIKGLLEDAQAFTRRMMLIFKVRVVNDEENDKIYKKLIELGTEESIARFVSIRRFDFINWKTKLVIVQGLNYFAALKVILHYYEEKRSGNTSMAVHLSKEDLDIAKKRLNAALDEQSDAVKRSCMAYDGGIEHLIDKEIKGVRKKWVAKPTIAVENNTPIVDSQVVGHMLQPTEEAEEEKTSEILHIPSKQIEYEDASDDDHEKVSIIYNTETLIDGIREVTMDSKYVKHTLNVMMDQSAYIHKTLDDLTIAQRKLLDQINEEHEYVKVPQDLVDNMARDTCIVLATLGTVITAWYAKKGIMEFVKPWIMNKLNKDGIESFGDKAGTADADLEKLQAMMPVDGHSEGAHHVIKSQRKKLEQKPGQSKFNPQPIGHASTRVLDLVNTVESNVVKVMIRFKISGVYHHSEMFCLFVQGRCALFTAHTLFALSKKFDDAHLILEGVTYKSSDLCIVADPDYDIALVYFKTMKQEKPTILHHFICDVNIKDNMGPVAILVKGAKSNTLHEAPVSTITAKNYRVGEETVACAKALAAVGSFAKGDCGSPWMVTHNSFPQQIVGIHVAGSRQVGYCTIVTQEMVRDMLKVLIENHKKDIKDALVEGHSGKFVVAMESEKCEDFGAVLEKIDEIQMDFDEFIDPDGKPEFDVSDYGVLVGVLKNKYKPRLPNRTSIEPSAIHGYITDPITMPAALKPVNGVSPFQEAVKRESTPNFIIPEEDHFILDSIAKRLAYNIPASHISRVLTIDEAINGIPLLDHLGPIDVSRSVGYPFSVMHNRTRTQKKHWLLKTWDRRGEPYYKVEDKYLLNMVEAAKHGKHVAAAVFLFLKDERRPIEKVLELKTRLIKGGSFSKFIADRQYFGSYVAAVMDNHQTGACKLGINPHQWQDWDAFARYLRLNLPIDFDKHCEDINGMDRNMCSVMMYYADKSIRYWYAINDANFTMLDDRIRSNLSMLDRCSLDVVGNCLVLTDHRNVSGCLLTTLRNGLGIEEGTIYVKIKLAWEDIPIEPTTTYPSVIYNGYKNHDGKVSSHMQTSNNIKRITMEMRANVGKIIEEIVKEVIIADFGDDDVIVDLKGNYSARKAKYGFKKYLGWTLTDFTKEDRDIEYHSNAEVNFLKRSFRYEDGIVFAPLDKTIIYEMLNWVSSKEDGIVILLSNCETALREAFHHGREFHDQLKGEIRHALESNGISFSYARNLKDAFNYELLLANYLTEEVVVSEAIGQGSDEVIGHNGIEIVENDELTFELPFVEAPVPERVLGLEEEEIRNRIIINVSRSLFSGKPVDLAIVAGVNGFMREVMPFEIDRMRANGFDVVEFMEELVSIIYDEIVSRVHVVFRLNESDRLRAMLGLKPLALEECHYMRYRFENMRQMGSISDRYKTMYNVAHSCYDTTTCTIEFIIAAVGPDHVERYLTSGFSIAGREVINIYPNNVPVLEVVSGHASEIVSESNSEQQLTKFIDEKDSVEETLPIYFEPNPNPYQSETIDVLSRTYTKNYTWSGSDTVGTEVFAFGFPEIMIDSYTNIAKKLDMFQYLRAGAKVDIRVNGTAFHSGKLLVSWMPHWNTSSTADVSFDDVYNMSVLNHVIVSPNGSVTSSFNIPYIGPDHWINLSHLADLVAGRIGYVKCRVLNVLRTSVNATVPSVNVAVNISFVKPEVAGPTNFSVSSLAEGHSSATVKEQEVMSDKRVLSRTLSVASDVSMLMGSVPIIGGIASKASPALKFVSSLAKSLGLGMPTDTSFPTQTVVKNDVTCWGVGLYTGDRLALDPAYRVSTDPSTIGTISDEMDYNYIFNIPAIVSKFDVDSSDVVGTVLKKIPITPNMCWVHQELVATVYEQHYHHTPTSYLGMFYRGWRGGMKIHLQLTASTFVTGRLGVLWFPSAHHVPANITDGSGDYIKAIWDFNGDSEIEFTIPYLNEKEMQRCVPYHTVIDSTYAHYVSDNLDYCNGTLVITVMNAVTSSDVNTYAVADINVWCSAAEDMTFYGPCSLPLYFEIAPELTRLKEKILEDASGHSGAVVSMRQQFKRQFAPIIDASAVIRHGGCDGEEIGDLRILLKRPSYIPGVTFTSGIAVDCEWKDFMGSSTGPIHLCAMYQFVRGSVRYYICTTGTTSAQPVGNVIVRQKPLVSLKSTATHNYTRPMTSTLLENFADGGSIQDFSKLRYMTVEVPYHSNAKFESTEQQLWTSEYEERSTLEVMYIKSGSDNQLALQFSVAAGDDFRLGWLKTPPHVIYNPPAALNKNKN